jgi:SMI1/KNR4 family protein SUKH-1
VIDWTAEIERMSRAKQLVAEAGGEDGYAPVAARPPADPERLRAAAERFGGALDSEYEEFLRHADGWPGLLHSFGVFGTAELLGPEYDEAVETVSYLEPDIFAGSGVEEESLVPIGMSPVAIDVFVMSTDDADPHPVIWFAGLEVERFPGFGAFFRYLIDANLELADQA